MAIYRGAGGAGDATNDATSQAIIATEAAIAAAASEDAAASSASAAATSATNAASSASSASTSATNAANSATAAAGSATSAASSASTATTQASNATNSATAAATSATNAATSEANALSYRNSALISRTISQTSATNAATSEANALSYRNSAANSATAAQNVANTVVGYVSQKFTATAGQTSFTVTYGVGYENVYLNGVKLVRGDDYIATSGTDIVLATGATVGDVIEVLVYGGFKGDTGATGPAGPANTLSIGTVASGASAAATITGTSPNQTLNLTLPKGDTGATGATGAVGPQGPAGVDGVGIPIGGSTGQVLKKNSNTDYDTGWLTLGSAAAANTNDFATAVQGTKADSALQPADIGTTVQAYDADLTSWAGIAPSAKQDTLVSGTNIKTINGTSVLGSGDLTISGGASIPVSDDGTQLTAGVTSFNFTGAGVTASASGNAVTVDIPGGGGGSSTLAINNKTAAYTVVASDLGKIINCTSGTFTVSLTSAATLGAGFNCWITNSSTSGSEYITIDPNASETIDGRSVFYLSQGQSIQIVCDGANWILNDGGRVFRGVAVNAYATAAAQGYVLATAANSTALGFNSGNTGSRAATGGGAMALGGSYASGTDSFAAAVANNTSTFGAKGASSICIGPYGLASGPQSVSIGGYGNIASGNYSAAIGGGLNGAQAIGNCSVAIGDGPLSSQYGKYAFSSGLFSLQGDSQTGTTVLRRATTDATATVLTSNNAAAATTNQVILPNNSAYAFTGIVVTRQSTAQGTASAAWKVEGLIRRDANAASTTLVASTVTAISNVPGWTLALSADTTNGGLSVTATGAAATNIRWVATIQTSEVTYA